MALARQDGPRFCTIVRDCQLRPFDYVLEDDEIAGGKAGGEDDSGASSKLQQMPIITGMDTNTQLKIIEIRLNELKQNVKILEKEVNE